MTTLTINKTCTTHVPNKSAISIIEDMRYTFCEECEQNIESWYDDTDEERLPMWRNWKVSN